MQAKWCASLSNGHFAMQACRFGHAAAARVLIHATKAQGCQERVVDALDGSGHACLHSAAQWGHVEVRRL